MWGRRHKKVAVAVVCADWRLHHKKSEFNRQIAKALRVDGVDFISVPGPNGLLLPDGMEAPQALSTTHCARVTGAGTLQCFCDASAASITGGGNSP